MGYTGPLEVQFYKQDKKVVINSAVTALKPPGGPGVHLTGQVMGCGFSL